MKKLLSLVLSLIIFVSNLSITSNAYADDEQVLMVADKFCSNLMEGDRFFYTTTSSQASKLNGKTYYTKGYQLYDLIKTSLLKRSTSFSVQIFSTKKLTKSELKSILTDGVNGAMSDEMSTSAVDGDYLKYQWHKVSYTGGDSPKIANGKYYYDVKLNFVYRSTADEEKQVDSVVSKFISSTDTSSMSDYQILKAIHDFVCSSTTYNSKAALFAGTTSNMYRTSFTAYGTLVEGSSVCQGYALAFYRLAKELGYDCRFVYSDPYQGCHAWNMVALNNKYYFVDTTWDDDKNKNELTYFLVDYQTLQKNDTDYQEHLIDNELNTASFILNYKNKLDQECYDSENQDLLTNCTISLDQKSYVYDGYAKAPKAIATKQNGETKSLDDYQISYISNTNVGEAVLKISDEDESSHRIFIIKPQKASNLKTKTRTTNSLSFSYTKTKSKSTGYAIYQLKGGRWTYLKSTNANTVSISSLSPNTTYQFRVREYTQVNNRRIYGDYSSIAKTNTSPKAPSISTISTAPKSITIGWKKVPCTKYEIRYSTASNMAGAKSIFVSSKATAKRITGLKKGKRYYIQIRAITTITGSNKKSLTYKSGFSAKKSITVK